MYVNLSIHAKAFLFILDIVMIVGLKYWIGTIGTIPKLTLIEINMNIDVQTPKAAGKSHQK